jgi:hypothetical protein
MKYSGGCHCGKVTFDVEADIAKVAQCNCSICSRKGYLLAMVPGDAVTVHAPDDALSTYTFNSHRIRHRFCPVCGVAPFGQGKDREGNPTYAVNVRCLDEIDIGTLDVVAFDGRSL